MKRPGMTTISAGKSKHRMSGSKRGQAKGSTMHWGPDQGSYDAWFDACRTVSQKGEVSYSRKPRRSLVPIWVRA